MNERADILIALQRLFGDRPYRLTPYKSTWSAWGAPKTAEATRQDHQLERFCRGLSHANKVFVRRRLLGSLTVGETLRAEAWRVYDGDICLAVAWIDPHFQMPVVMPTWSDK